VEAKSPSPALRPCDSAWFYFFPTADYTATNKDELSFTEDAVFFVLNSDDPSWWLAKDKFLADAAAKTGLVPQTSSGRKLPEPVLSLRDAAAAMAGRQKQSPRNHHACLISGCWKTPSTLDNTRLPPKEGWHHRLLGKACHQEHGLQVLTHLQPFSSLQFKHIEMGEVLYAYEAQTDEELTVEEGAELLIMTSMTRRTRQSAMESPR
jgi:hypothetical protein